MKRKRERKEERKKWKWGKEDRREVRIIGKKLICDAEETME